MYLPLLYFTFTIRESTRLMNLPILVADRRHYLFGHICHLSQEVPVHRTLKLAIDIAGGVRPATDWKRHRGRPKTDVAATTGWRLWATRQHCIRCRPGSVGLQIATTIC